MDHVLAVTNFIQTYGSPLTRILESGNENLYAIISPVNDLGASKETIEYTKAGFLPRQVYLLLLPASENPLKGGEILVGKTMSFRIKEAEHYFLGETPMYQRVYAYEMRNVEK